MERRELISHHGHRMREDIRNTSRTAHLLELPATAHATELFETHPELIEMIAVWLRRHL